ncbi:MAG: chemotaxis protein [Crocinitomicaceae bacterium]
MANKVKWIGGCLIVFVLILATNLIDKNHFERIEKSVSNIYEDRLVAKDLIFKMSQHMNEKSLAIANADSIFFSLRNNSVNQSFENLIQDFYKTELVEKEEKALDLLELQFTELKKIEENYVREQDVDQNELILDQINLGVLAINESLVSLSEIQMEEGRRQQSIASSSLSLVSLISRFEIVALVVLGLIIQVIILYKPKAREL